MDQSTHTNEVIQRSISALEAEKQKVESALNALRQMLNVAESNGGGEKRVAKKEEVTKVPKKDRRSETARARMTKVWDLARRAEAAEEKKTNDNEAQVSA